MNTFSIVKNQKWLLALVMGLALVFIQANTSYAASENMIEKQGDIDKYLFEDHVDELVEKGIHVTHTAPEDSYIVMGISPYSEESANYLKEIFGEDEVKVVEGEMAKTFETGMETTSTEIATGAFSTETEESSSSFPTIKGVIGVAILTIGTVYFVSRKKRTA